MKIQAIHTVKVNNNQQCHIQNTAEKAPQTLQRKSSSPSPACLALAGAGVAPQHIPAASQPATELSNTPLKSFASETFSDSGVYNPIYYKDYNVQISFGKRSPEDFYSQDFNKNNMPETMKKYLNTKVEERSKIAPVQIMHESFAALEDAFTVDDIKRAFPNEPKFKKLRPANYAGANVGILKKIKDIKALQETPAPLFKDGCDDLTTYLVKKIYLEGKTAKEIDKDFAKDINSVYELAAKVPDETKKALGKNESVYFSHSTIYNLGIRFPELPFWNSFISTRDDYERIQRVKSETGEFVNANSPEGKAILARRQAAQSSTPRPRKYTFKPENIQNISDSIVNAKGETKRVLRSLERSGRNKEELTFLQKYWSHIMSVATEKIHLSEEMIDFNNNRRVQKQKIDEAVLNKLISGDNLTNSEQTPLKVFWNERPDLKMHFSKAITDTTILFTDAYGADGNNEEFKSLIAYAESIKPTREAQKLEHQKIQAEYDELAQKLQEQNSEKKLKIENLKSQIQECHQVAQEPEERVFKYIFQGREITMPFDIKVHSDLTIENDFTLIPRKLLETYKREMNNILKDDKERFWLTASEDYLPDIPEIKNALFSDEELLKLNDDLITVMEIKHNSKLEATRMALLEYAFREGIMNIEEAQQFSNSDILLLRNNIQEKLLKTGKIETATNEIESIFNQYSAPLSNKERIKIKINLFKYLKNYSMANTMSPNTSIAGVLQLLSDGINSNEGYAKALKTIINDDKMLDFEGPVLRYIIEPHETNKRLADIVSEHILKFIVYRNPETISIITTANPNRFVQLLSAFPEEMKAIYETSANIMMKNAIHKLKI